MTKQEFLYESASFIFKEVAKATNQLCGQSKTSTLVANLFVTLPVEVEARLIQSAPKPAKKLNALEEFVTAYIKHDDSSKVTIAFFYAEEKDFKRIMKRIHKFPTFFAYLYMREALKSSRLMNTQTHYHMMSAIIKHNAPSISRKHHYALSNVACNYAVNSTISKLFKASKLANELDVILEGQHFDSSYADQNLSEMDILKDMLQNHGHNPSDTKLDENFSYDEETNSIFPCNFEGYVSRDEAITTDLGESVTNALATMSRGTGSAPIFEESFNAVKVKTGWFKKLTAKFAKDVHYITDTFRAEWSNLNIVYRHKFKAPAHKHSDPKLSLILSIDHSGSVATEGLQKLLYLFNKHSQKITEMYIIIHDDDIVKEFKLNSDYDIGANAEFTKALSNRIACGGTSHFKVFKRIDELITKKQIDPNKTIYVSFSDNYSDIPRSWDEVKSLRKLFSTVFLTPQSNPMNIQGTMDIAMS